MMTTIVALTGYLLLHVVAYTRVANGLGLTARGRLGLKIGLVLAALPFVLVRVFGRSAWVAPLLLVAYTWLGVLAMAVALFPVERLLSLVFAERRKTITVGALVLLAPLAVSAAPNRPPRRRARDARLCVTSRRHPPRQRDRLGRLLTASQ